ncbi:MAG: 30S ribosomal protein S6 [bacterium]|nr:30S ribosomal protein S6 [bacterium]
MIDTSTQEESLSIYELTCLLRSEEDIAFVRSLLGQHDARVIQEHPLSKVELQYPIKGERYAFLGLVTFEVPTANLHSLRSALQLQDRVLRCLITHPVPTHGVASREKPSEERTPREGSSRVSYPSPERKPTRDILSNEALRGKIEEILE